MRIIQNTPGWKKIDINFPIKVILNHECHDYIFKRLPLKWITIENIKYFSDIYYLFIK